MEAIEQELAEKSIERSDAVKEVIVEEKPKPKRERTQAQKEAFEKARAKRKENLAKKKQAEAEASQQVGEEAQQELENKIEATPKKKRGRPRKSAIKKEEPPAEHFIQPQQVNPRMMNHYPIQGQSPYQFAGFNPYFNPQPPQQPVINNYYHYHSQDREVYEPQRTLTPEPVVDEPEPQVSFDDEYEEQEYELPPDPRLKFRIAG
jgi:hypothetical protein|tara:strand:+ start:5023 stop:5637 length:615 start_codon:yes stop_codon:yes gene_type:complete